MEPQQRIAEQQVGCLDLTHPCVVPLPFIDFTPALYLPATFFPFKDCTALHTALRPQILPANLKKLDNHHAALQHGIYIIR